MLLKYFLSFSRNSLFAFGPLIFKTVQFKFRDEGLYTLNNLQRQRTADRLTICVNAQITSNG
jgi:hypothetical protein